MNNKGFTLIELLTVISIIAILAAITLVTFPLATQRAADARVVNAMQQLRTAAQARYGADGNYDDVIEASSDATILALVNEIKDHAEENGETPNVEFGLYEKPSDTTQFCVSAELQGGGWWCVDHNMFSGKTDDNMCANDSETFTACDTASS